MKIPNSTVMQARTRKCS